jgi:hypothetical protein
MPTGASLRFTIPRPRGVDYAPRMGSRRALVVVLVFCAAACSGGDAPNPADKVTHLSVECTVHQRTSGSGTAVTDVLAVVSVMSERPFDDVRFTVDLHEATYGVIDTVTGSFSDVQQTLFHVQTLEFMQVPIESDMDIDTLTCVGHVTETQPPL